MQFSTIFGAEEEEKEEEDLYYSVVNGQTLGEQPHGSWMGVDMS